MGFFDFSEDVWRAVAAASDDAEGLSAKTTVHRAKFPSAVIKAGFQLLSQDSPFTPGKNDVVVGAAPWSNPDLWALEDLVSHARSGNIRVVVFDVDSIPYPEMVRLVPGLGEFRETPVVLRYRNGELTYFGQGHAAVLWLRQI